MNLSHPTPNVETSRVKIARGDLARIRNGRGSLLSVREGTVWITQSGSTDDTVLAAGESFRIDRNGLTLVSACGPMDHALVSLASELRVAASPSRRLWAVLRGALMPSRPASRGT